jgi:hypothetical protein
LYKVITIPNKNYTGPTFAETLSAAINAAWNSERNLKFDVLYEWNDNTITIVQLNYTDGGVDVRLVSGADLQAGKNWSSRIPQDIIISMTGVLRIGKTTYMLTAAAPYKAYIDLNTTKNFYLTSSCLASYNTISKLDNDVVIKKIPVKASYSQMLFDNTEAGYDYLDVSRRALSRIDCRL